MDEREAPRTPETSAAPVLVDNTAAYVQTLGEIFSAVRMQLDIYSVNFRREEYGIEENLAILREWIRNHSRARIRVLVHHAQAAMFRGHGFIELGLQLTSFVEFRDPAQSAAPMGDMVIADGRHLLRRPTADARHAEYWNDLPLKAHDARKEFDALWNDGQPSQHIRNLHI